MIATEIALLIAKLERGEEIWYRDGNKQFIRVNRVGKFTHQFADNGFYAELALPTEGGDHYGEELLMLHHKAVRAQNFVTLTVTPALE